MEAFSLSPPPTNILTLILTVYCQLSASSFLFLAEIHSNFVENYCPKLSFVSQFSLYIFWLNPVHVRINTSLSLLWYTFFACLLAYWLRGRQKSIGYFETNQKVTNNLLTSYMTTFNFFPLILFHCEMWYKCKFQKKKKQTECCNEKQNNTIKPHKITELNTCAPTHHPAQETKHHRKLWSHLSAHSPTCIPFPHS